MYVTGNYLDTVETSLHQKKCEVWSGLPVLESKHIPRRNAKPYAANTILGILNEQSCNFVF
jgi:hypothetical protein